MNSSIRTLTTRLGEAGNRISAISARLGNPQPRQRRATRLGVVEPNAGDGGTFWDWVKSIFTVANFEQLVDLYKKLADAGLIKAPYPAPEQMTELQLRQIIADVIAAGEKPLWEKVLPYAAIGTLGTILAILLLKRR